MTDLVGQKFWAFVIAVIAFLCGMLADYSAFDAEREKILKQLEHERTVVQQYRIDLERNR